MIIVTTQAERKAIEWMEDANAQSSYVPRAIHVRQCDALFNEPRMLSADFTQTLAHAFKDAEVRVFILYDGDIIIAGKGITTSHYHEVKAYVSHYADHTIEAMTFYEKGINWFHMDSLLKRKFDALTKHIEKGKANAEKVKKEQIRQSALNQTFPDELLCNIDKRRTEREGVEIVIVEDDPFSRTLVQRSLKTLFSISSAEDGHDAISAYVHKAPDVMFLDIDLPDVNGHEILHKVLSIDPNAYIIMLSGNGDQKNVLSAMKNGAKGFVAKPFAKEKLLAYIQKAPTYQPTTH